MAGISGHINKNSIFSHISLVYNEWPFLHIFESTVTFTWQSLVDMKTEVNNGTMKKITAKWELSNNSKKQRHFANKEGEAKMSHDFAFFVLSVQVTVSRTQLIIITHFITLFCTIFYLLLPLSLYSFSNQTPHKKWSFTLRISSINVTKSAGNCAVKVSTNADKLVESTSKNPTENNNSLKKKG